VLPTPVDQEKAQATYKDGGLELRLPKSEAAKPKRIAITS
jgi:HSP20 family protein